MIDNKGTVLCSLEGNKRETSPWCAESTFSFSRDLEKSSIKIENKVNRELRIASCVQV